MKKVVLLIILAILLLKLASAGLVINEIMYDPDQCSDSYCEWIEIYNDGTGDIDLANYTLCSDNLEAGYINNTDSSTSLNTSLILPGGKYAIITEGGSGSTVLDYFSIDNTTLMIHTDASSICGGLSNSGENISLAEGNTTLWANYTTSMGANGDNNSLAYCSNTFSAKTPSPGAENSCEGPSQVDPEDLIYLELDWEEDDIVNGKEFEIDIKAFNLEDKKYDIKIWIINDDGDILSERYDNDNEEWKSGNYYVDDFFDSKGNRSKDIKVRIKEEYRDLDGRFELHVKLRRGSSTVSEEEKTIKILEKEDDPAPAATPTPTLTTLQSNTISTNTNDPIMLSSSNSSSGGEINETKKNSIIYKSKNEYIRDGAIYMFSLLCIIIIILLLIDKR